jgi:endonuclease YncB( thermonuclease family)
VGAHRLTPALAASLVVLLGAGCGDRTETEGAPVVTEATVARVNDGDTLTLTGGAKVRLVQVDAPELTTDCFGREALHVLADLVPAGTRIRLVRDPRLDDRDRYGRLLRYVVVGDTDVNVELVRRGAASPYFYRGERGRHADELLDAVASARDAGRGYWGACPDARLNPGLGSLTGDA